MVKVELKVVIEKAEIKQPGMNPWRKDLKRTVYTDGQKCFIRWKGFNYSHEINGKEYREVKNYGNEDRYYLQ
ncbi:hypothetical protein SD71_16065 [Cohnella kolymensis]|uniref:Transposase n=1 Tax=Cohnella kolymensis TaxID=1590652 RepID=A0ABR5A249_9BACL|nr:hypothetical protein [Cohnella kolymensis]KIL35143.1 hypothetical protein SD71_16065 [Cohnella kolymensis]